MSTKPAIDAILFDKDGTLLDFQASWGGWAADTITHLTRTDPGRRRELAEMLQVDMDARLILPASVIIAGTPDDITATICDFFPDMGRAALLDEIIRLSRAVRPIPVAGLRGALERLAGWGIRLGVATNDAETIARDQMRVLGLDDLFDFVAGFDSGHGGKPAPGMCLAFARAMGCAPDRIAMVGDSLHDLHAGAAAGMRTVAVLTGVATAADLKDHAEVVLPDVTHLGRWLGHD